MIGLPAASHLLDGPGLHLEGARVELFERVRHGLTPKSADRRRPDLARCGPEGAGGVPPSWVGAVQGRITARRLSDLTPSGHPDAGHVRRPRRPSYPGAVGARAGGERPDGGGPDRREDDREGGKDERAKLRVERLDPARPPPTLTSRTSPSPPTRPALRSRILTAGSFTHGNAPTWLPRRRVNGRQAHGNAEQRAARRVWRSQQEAASRDCGAHAG